MAELNVTRAESVPAELLARFLPQEAPVFRVVQECGSVRLWQSSTPECTLPAFTMSGQTRYHITTGDTLEFNHLPDLHNNALPLFEMTCAAIH